MIFVTNGDIEVLIRADMLQHIIGTDSTLLNKAELAAIQKIRTYLKTRYDVNAVFAASGADRNELILIYTIDIMLYDLHSRINPRKIPDLRRTRYKEAMEWLKQVQQGELCAELPKAVNNNGQQIGSDDIKWGSNPKREHYF
ncbi:MAG: DUF1320 domain-containing protein [Flavobacteriales bacterium]|jgi:phage gp36-like protein|nr:DUF1320 domain-containing protein [Flavobacteriales bacterium]